MKKVKVTADLELKSEDGNVIIKSDDNNIDIVISSSSAVVFPFKTYFKYRQYLSLTENISQKIQVIIEAKKIIIIYNGNVDYHEKWWLFKFLLKSILNKDLK